MDSTVLACIITFFIFAALGTPIIIAYVKRSPKYQQAQKEKQEKLARDQNIQYARSLAAGDLNASVRFYRECAESGISDVQKSSSVAKIELFAQNHEIHMSVDQLKNAYMTGKAEVERIQKQERISKITAEELAIEQQHERYRKVLFRDKRIAYYSDKIKECDMIISACDDAVNKVKSGAGTTYRSGKKKEMSWAVAGGAASAIGGAAAGVATAIDVQQRNAEIQQYNADLLHSVAGIAAMQVVDIYRKQSEAEKEKQKWMKELEAAKQALYEDVPNAEAFKSISIRHNSYTISETGVAHLDIYVAQQSPRRMIYSDTKAVVDGSLLVSLKKGGKVFANGVYTINPDLARQGDTTSDETICRPAGASAIPVGCSVEIVPEKLWFIETNQ